MIELENKIDVNGDGRLLYYKTAGDNVGKPTVIFEAGYNGIADSWSRVLPTVANLTRVFAYDRFGLGDWCEETKKKKDVGSRSGDDGVPQSDCENAVNNLKALLSKANINPPYILVGHSFGGMIVRHYANKFLNEVVGIVLVDTTHEEQMDLMAPYLSSEVRDYYINKHQHDICWEQLRKSKRFYGKMPLIVLSAGLQDFVHTEKSQQIWHELHRDFLNLSANSKHIIAEQSTHEIHRIEPQLVIAAIEDIINSYFALS